MTTAQITGHMFKEMLSVDAEVEGVDPIPVHGGKHLMSVERVHIRYVNSGDGWGVDAAFVSGRFVGEDGWPTLQPASRRVNQSFYETMWPMWLETLVRDLMPGPDASIRKPTEVLS